MIRNNVQYLGALIASEVKLDVFWQFFLFKWSLLLVTDLFLRALCTASRLFVHWGKKNYDKLWPAFKKKRPEKRPEKIPSQILPVTVPEPIHDHFFGLHRFQNQKKCAIYFFEGISRKKKYIYIFFLFHVTKKMYIFFS